MQRALHRLASGARARAPWGRAMSPPVARSAARSMAWPGPAHGGLGAPHREEWRWWSPEACFTTFAARGAQEPGGGDGGASTSGGAHSPAPQPSPLQQLPSAPIVDPGSGVVRVAAPGALAGASTSCLRDIPMSPKKMNLFARMVRRMHVEDAIIQSEISPKRAGVYVAKVLKNARANATHNYGLDGAKLFVKEAFVSKGEHMKRVAIHGRGKSGMRERKRCHLTVVLREAGAGDRVRPRVRVVPWTPGGRQGTGEPAAA